MGAPSTERRLAQLLGLFSTGLGISQIAVPERVNHLIGVRDTPTTRAIQRAVGVQELSAAGGIYSMSPPTPFLFARLAGDGLHLALLARAMKDRRSDRDRLRATIASVAGITLLDAVASALYARSAPTDPYARQQQNGDGTRIQTPSALGDEPLEASAPGNPSITINATEDEIRRRLGDFEIERHGEVTFATAPGDRGTEVHVDVTKSRNPLKKVVGEDPEQKVRDSLRRLKQVIEVGEVTVSDAAPEGISAKRQLKQRPAQPLQQKELAKVGREG